LARTRIVVTHEAVRFFGAEAGHREAARELLGGGARGMPDAARST
jgi:salicylate synthetase